MKKIYLVICINFFLVSLASAQISKGSLWLGGNIGFSTGKNTNGDNSNQSSYSISPSVGTAIKKNTILGVQALFDHNESEDPLSEYTRSSSGGAIFIRQYWEVINRCYVFGNFSGSYLVTRQKQTYQNYATDSKAWTATLGASPGVAFSATNWLQLEAEFYNLFSASYSSADNHLTSQGTQSSYKSHTTTAGINLENASSFTLGVRFLIKR